MFRQTVANGLPLVVGFQSSFQIAGATDISLISLAGAGNVLNEVDVFHIGERKRKTPAFAIALAGILRSFYEA